MNGRIKGVDSGCGGTKKIIGRKGVVLLFDLKKADSRDESGADLLPKKRRMMGLGSLGAEAMGDKKEEECDTIEFPFEFPGVGAANGGRKNIGSMGGRGLGIHP